MIILSILSAFGLFYFFPHKTNSFTLQTNARIQCHCSQTKILKIATSTSSQKYCSNSDNNEDNVNNDDSWENLLTRKNSAVKKLIIEEGNGLIPTKGSKIEISYIGRLAGSQKQWSVDDVIETWLQYQQGLNDLLEEPFRNMNVDGKTLMDENKFTEEFVKNELGISNKIQCKKTIMAAKRLWNQTVEFPQGFEFDTSAERGKNFEFVLGSGKVIKGMDVAVSTMKVGEKARIFCRSDYAYGSEGYRTRKGDVVVPPYRSLIFDIELVSVSDRA